MPEMQFSMFDFPGFTYSAFETFGNFGTKIKI